MDVLSHVTDKHFTLEVITMQQYLDSFIEMISLRGLSDRTMNAAISQLRFFTMFVLHKQWDPYQLPMRKFDTYIPFVPTKEEVAIY